MADTDGGGVGKWSDSDGKRSRELRDKKARAARRVIGDMEWLQQPAGYGERRQYAGRTGMRHVAR